VRVNLVRGPLFDLLHHPWIYNECEAVDELGIGGETEV
jgi:hypothetical protein